MGKHICEMELNIYVSIITHDPHLLPRYMKCVLNSNDTNYGSWHSDSRNLNNTFNGCTLNRYCYYISNFLKICKFYANIIWYTICILEISLTFFGNICPFTWGSMSHVKKCFKSVSNTGFKAKSKWNTHNNHISSKSWIKINLNKIQVLQLTCGNTHILKSIKWQKKKKTCERSLRNLHDV
jgi:hypothetical protein